MIRNFKKRVLTSIVLLALLFAMLLNNFILTFFLLIIGVVSILEFFKINSIKKALGFGSTKPGKQS